MAHPSQDRHGPPITLIAAFILLVVGVAATWIMHAPAELAAIVIAAAVLALGAELTHDPALIKASAKAGAAGISWERAPSIEAAVLALDQAETTTPVRTTESIGDEISPDFDTTRRAAIERIITESVAWGYDHAWLFTTTPRPVIAWNADGTPRIEFGTTAPHD